MIRALELLFKYINDQVEIVEVLLKDEVFMREVPLSLLEEMLIIQHYYPILLNNLRKEFL